VPTLYWAHRSQTYGLAVPFRPLARGTRLDEYGNAIGLRSNCSDALESDLHAGSPKRRRMFLYNYIQNPNSRNGKVLPQRKI
jgi:hypothetical protein